MNLIKKNQLKQAIPFAFIAIIAIISTVFTEKVIFNGEKVYNSADITWIMCATALVFLMTPGLAFFYGGMVNRKNVISTMIKSIVASGMVTIWWVTIGFSLCFGESIGGIIGNPTTFIFFKDVLSGAPWNGAPTIPLVSFAIFQLMFAIITPGLVVGAVAERIKFRSYILFIPLFCTFIYAPLAHWTWHPEGILFKMGVLDFAGGTVVHISAGCAALAGAMVLKRRKSLDEGKEIPPANIPYVLIGTGLLWFGWFGFNGGSALAANGTAALAIATTCISAAAAGCTWMFYDVMIGKKPTVTGFCIGAVVGLVGITPSAGFVSITHAITIGAISAVISNIVVQWKFKGKIDDTLDVFPCHGIGGIVGMILTGVFAQHGLNPVATNGLLFGNWDFFALQSQGVILVTLYSFIVAYGIFKFINLLSPIRVSPEEEEIGLDQTQHNEKYVQGTLILEKNEERALDLIITPILLEELQTTPTV